MHVWSNNPTIQQSNIMDLCAGRWRLLFGRYMMLACAFVILAMLVVSVRTWACHVTTDMQVAQCMRYPLRVDRWLEHVEWRNIVPIRLCRAPVVTFVYVRGVTCACPIMVTVSDYQPSFPMFAILVLFVSSIWYSPMELCDDTLGIIEVSTSSSVENGNFGYDK